MTARANGYRSGDSASPVDTEVLVVGGGPTGTMLACGLAGRGIGCRVVDKAPERFRWSRALVIHARTLEVMDLAASGVADELVKRGYTVKGLNMAANDTGAALVEMRKLDSRFPFVLLLPQRETEEILEKVLLGHGSAVERGLELISLEDRGDMVESVLKHPDGLRETIKSRYVVGCDGSQSTVRDMLEMPFEGASYRWINFLADVKVEGDVPRGGVRQYCSDRGLVFLASFGDDYYRLVAIDYTKQHVPTKEALELSDLQETVDAVVPTKWSLSGPRRIGRFRSSHRQVPRYRSGRVFLAGDAAHLHAPAGGQGLNAGVQDAFNLAWKLAMVLNGEAPSDLLDSYNSERHQADAKVLALSDVIFRSALIKNPSLKAARELAARVLVHLPLVQKLLATNLSGLGIDYRGVARRTFFAGAVPRRLPKWSRERLGPGCRIPDLDLLDRDGTSTRLYELVRDSGYKLLIGVSMANLNADRGLVEEFANELRTHFGERVKPFVVLDEGIPGAMGGDLATFVDYKQEAYSKLGLRHGSILLLRPDGFLLHAGRIPDLRSLLEASSGWITKEPKVRADLPSGERHEEPSESREQVLQQALLGTRIF